MIFSGGDQPSPKIPSKIKTTQSLTKNSTSLILLGTLQDAGSSYLG